MTIRTFGELGYLAFVAALIATAVVGGQTLIETMPANAEARPASPARPATTVALEEPVKKELTPLFPILHDKRSPNELKRERIEAAKPRVAVAIFRQTPTARLHPQTRSVANLPKPTMSTSFTAENTSRTGNIFGFLAADR